MKIWKAIVYIGRRFFADDCANRAASLAYTTLLSLVPLVIVVFWVLSLFPAFQGTGETLQTFVVNNFVASSARVISVELNRFLLQLQVLSWANLLALGVISILMIYDLVGAFNSIWHVKVKRNFAVSLSFYSLILLLSPIFLGVLMVLITRLGTQPLFIDLKHISYLGKSFFYILPYLAAVGIFTFFNWALPSCHVPFRFAALAGLITTIFFEVAKYVFSWYVGFFSAYRIIYGALAIIPIFLLWIYISWVIILLGALICQVLTQSFYKNKGNI